MTTTRRLRLAPLGLAWLAGGGLLLLAIGCRTPSAAAGTALREIQVRVLPERKVEVRGTVVPFERLPAQLRWAGAAADTEIRIAVPADVNPDVLQTLAGELKKARYQRVVFTTPRKVDAGTGHPAAAGPSAPGKP